MNTFTPSGEIKLVKAPLEKDYDHQLTFNSLTAQATYFNSLAGSGYVDYTYIKKDNQIRIGECIDDLLQFNYLFYRNNSGKTYYCFIDNMTYLNDNCTLISFSTDVIQTYLFDMDFTKKSLIDRQHTTEDSNAGLTGNQYPENLEHGEYIYHSNQNTVTGPFGASSDFCWVVAVSDVIDGLSISSPSSKIPDGLYYIGLVGNDKVVNLRNLIRAYTQAEKLNAIYSVFVAPTLHFSNTDSHYVNGSLEFYYRVCTQKEITLDIPVSKSNSLPGGIVPRNWKLLSNDYNFIQVSNNNGCCYNYNIWDFNDTSNIKFTLIGSLGIGGSYYLYPKNYKNIAVNYDEGIPLGKLPVGSFISDTYLNWLTQNSLNVFGITKLTPEAQGYIASGLETIKGIGNLAIGNSEGAVDLVGGAIKGLETYNQIYHQKQVPDQVEGNTNCADACFSIDRINFTFKQMGIKPYYANRLDAYFDKYGYKDNIFTNINIHTRTYWNYLKTVECNIESKSTSTIPQEYLQKIKSIFNKGITFWHNPEHFLDYTQTNSIIS